jgi:hypothetical protein
MECRVYTKRWSQYYNLTLQINDHKKVAQRAMSTKDPDVQPFLKRLHERMDRWVDC